MSKKKNARSKPFHTPAGRLSFPSLKEPNTGGQYPSGKYEAELYIPDTKENQKWFKQFIATCEEVAKQQWGSSVNMETIDIPLRLGAEKDLEKYPHAEGTRCIKAKSKEQPVLADQQRTRIEPELIESELYGGCWTRLNIGLFAYSAGRNKGIGVGLNGVQKVRDDEPFGSSASRDPEDLFPETGSGDEFEGYEDNSLAEAVDKALG